MKLKSLLCVYILYICIVNTKAQSCCAGGSGSCTVSGLGYDILPDADKHVVGINYALTTYATRVYPTTTMNMGGGDMTMIGPGEAAKGYINTLQLFGRFQLPKRFQLSLSVPISFAKETSATAINHQTGLGDISVAASYAVFNRKKFQDKKNKHQIKVGLGVKTPTGKFTMNSNGFTNDLQLGTGSVDLLFSASYSYRYKKFGASAMAIYKKNLANKYHYQFGDKLKESIHTFLVFPLNKAVTISPLLGASYEHNFFDVYQKKELNYTGSDLLSAVAGLDIYCKHFALSSKVCPVLYSLTHWQGEAVPLLTFETGFFYNF